MHYCPYCSTQISEKAKSCHACKKSLDFNTIASVFKPREDSQVNKRALRKIWIKEHARFVWPLVFLIMGFIAGGILLYGFAKAEAAGNIEVLNTEIDRLKSEISQASSQAQNAQSGLQKTLDSKDQVIAILTNQRQTLTRIINFTRRFANNSVITANTPADATSFRNNFRYLKRQFDTQQTELNASLFENNRNFNIQTIPQFLTD